MSKKLFCLLLFYFLLSQLPAQKITSSLHQIYAAGLSGKNNETETKQTSYGLGLINGFLTDQGFFIGIRSELLRENSENIIPVSLRFANYFSDNKVAPVLGLEGGYIFYKSNDSKDPFFGKPFYEINIGTDILFKSNFAGSFTLGLRKIANFSNIKHDINSLININLGLTYYL
ncbi:MAG: hypothetical protein A2W91_12640 [Bacteroidetes bacterium GWF2_38_335]|nr:MAG: hypothetical protein A2W91_12640 [Bacteroidetes bacterium GWF2_38_335]OFY77014.1 MAG: hypothetical protein A2281_00755 [Bacteroidetes bacterium RIFOXYA12_FULL_38_20]HBS86872.1 hypothetical protein [Bacteroidales bacterium]